ncbi:transglutaminase family protein [Microvirga zambiensis]|uniref:transglutaminase family protein n=1 Tax=Microvirga zambiensis TaxID=1402137 RepID=UPI00191E794F|nr:transglutaminase family protein [Microvirga zambiensis]
MALLEVRHVTTYRYQRPVSFGEHRIMFRPRDSYDQRLLGAKIEIEPAPSAMRWIHDVFGNCVAIARFAGEAAELRFDSNIRLDHQPLNAPDFQMEDYAQTYPFAYSAEEMPDLMRTMERQYLDPDHQIHRWVQKFLHQGRPTRTGELLMTLTYAIKESFTYSRRSETGIQDPLMTLMLNRGSCRDFAILMIEAVRALGLAARFVSGYIYSPSLDGSGHIGGGSTHAWCQVYLPGAGWVEFDPTNGIIGNRDLIRIAVARDPRQAVPLSGTWMGKPGDFEEMTVEVNVTSPEDRPTRHVSRTAPPVRAQQISDPQGAR